MQNNKILALVIFAMSILIAQQFIFVDTMAQLTIETATFGETFSISDFPNCEYVSSTSVWCATSDGVIVWNPTTRTVVTQLLSGNSISDIRCGSAFCYAWDILAVTTNANLTKILISDRSINNQTTFTGNTGFVPGLQIGLVAFSSGQVASNVLLLPIEGQSCGGGANEKGMCVFDGATFDDLRFISSTQTADTNIVYSIVWNGETASVESPTANRAIVKFRDAVGNFQYYNIDLADGDTTFATTQICNTGNVASVTQQSRMVVINGVLYDSYSTSDLLLFDTTNSSCAETSKSNLVDENAVVTTSYSASDNLFIISARTADGSSPELNGLYTFNATTFGVNGVFDRILKVNLTSSAPNHINFHFMHPSEGEIQVWRGSDMVIISGILESSGETPTEEFCSQPENENILICRLEDSPPLTGASELLNQSSTNIVCMIGLLSCTQDAEGNFTPDNPDIQTNGVGYLLTIVTFGILISIFWLASGGRLGDIPTFVWFIATLSVLGLMVGFGFLDVTFLLIGVIAIIALAVAKAKGIFGDSGLFKGEGL